jgi:FMN phosphatase YigB (HAD superfamily)
MTDKPILYFDMDNVLVDFQSGLDQVPEEEKAMP